jgi:polar amino acid transport system substrate-binding protein
MKVSIAGLCAMLVAIGTASSAIARTGCQPNKIAEKYPTIAGKVERIGISPAYAPYEYADPSDTSRLIGSDIEISEQALACGGVKYEYLRGVFAGLLPAVSGGQIDALVENVYATPQRAKAMNFVVYMRAGGAAVVPKGNPKKLEAAGDLCGLKAVSVVGTAALKELQELQKKCADSGKPSINILQTSDMDAAYLGLENGRGDFLIDNAGSAALRVSQKDSNVDVAFTIPEDALIGIAVAKDNEALLQAYYDGIKAEQENGAIEKIFAKYHLDKSLIVPVQIIKSNAQ